MSREEIDPMVMIEKGKEKRKKRQEGRSKEEKYEDRTAAVPMGWTNAVCGRVSVRWMLLARMTPVRDDQPDREARTARD